MKRFAVTLLVAVSMLGVGAGVAAAATPGPGAAIINYTGTGTVTSADSSASYPLTWTVDCTGNPCTITGVLSDASSGVDFPLTGGILQPFVGGKGTYSYPDTGDVCADGYVGAYTIVIVATAKQIAASFDLPLSGEFDCPNNTTVGYEASHVEMTATVASGDTCYIFATCVTAAASPIPVIVAGSPTPARDVKGTTITSPSTLSTLPTIASALSATNAAWAAAAATVLVILVALPSHLINVAVENGAEKFAVWRRRGRIERTAPVNPAKPVRFAGWPFAAAGVLVASVISSFVNPGFGFNGASVRVFLSILVSFLVDAAVGWFIVIWLVRRATPHVTAAFRFVPATLVIVAAAVVFSRITGFQPGIVFGLVAGVLFGSTLAVADKAKVAIVPLAYSFAVALVGWLGYSILALVVGTHPAGLVLFVQETLSSITIAGIAAVPIALLPLRGLAGHDIFHWNRWIWGAAYAVGLFGFFLVLMPKPFSWASVGLSIWVWGALFLLYALIGVGLWLVVVRPWRRAAVEKTTDETAPLG